MWRRDELKEKSEQVRGRAEEVLGDLRDSIDPRAREAEKNREGKAKEAWSKAGRRVGEAGHDAGDRLKQ